MTGKQCDCRCYREQGHSGSHDFFTGKQVKEILKACKIKRKNPSIGLRDFMIEVSRDKKKGRGVRA